LKTAKLHISAFSRRPSSARQCSGDPVCADHDPVHAQTDCMLHGAGATGVCSSPSNCEANVSLDRALLADTVSTVGAAFF
jgi:hypothetical protein